MPSEAGWLLHQSNASRRSIGRVAHVQGLQAPVAELKPVQPKPLRLKVNPYEGKEGETLHFWVREVKLAMDAALISNERLRVAFTSSNLGGRAKTWAYTREATTPAAFLPANYEYHQRSRFLACKHGKRELHEYTQEMRVLTASLVGNPLPEHIKVTVFMDGLKVGPSRTQLFRVHANTMEEAIQIALQEEYNLRQARTPTSVWQGHNASTGAVQGASSAVTDVGSSGTCNVPALREGKGSSLSSLGARESCGRSHNPRARGLGSPVGEGRPTGEDLNPHGWSADSARHEGLATESLGDLETRKRAAVNCSWYTRVILIDSGASTNFARYQTVARNGDKYADASRESEGRGQVSVRLADGTVVNVPGVRMDLTVKFEDIDSTESFLVLDMDKYDLILDMSTSTRSIAITASPNAESRRAVWASSVAVPDGTGQAGNIGPQAVEAAEESSKGISSVGNLGPRKVKETEKKKKSATCVSSVGNVVPREVEMTSTRAEVSLSASRVDNQIPTLGRIFDGVSGRQVKADAVHLEAMPEVSALLNIVELSMKDFLAELKAGEIAEVVLLKPEISP
ncbi:Gag protein [Phytophthora palmivora]|uniref:Gag protein n=1 Tax=Phytophthora palmivora TaxID=4796 RepID=A0A2P4YLT8_9STRA|nr:Gag protein [Phytophthora palmivora]